MKVEKEQLGASRWVLTVEVPTETVWSSFESELQKLRKNIELPGFRRGKAPLSLLRQKYSKAIEADILKEQLPELYHSALREASLDDVVSLPDIEIIQAQMGETLKFKAIVETEPPVELAPYEGLTVVRERVALDDDIISKHIERLRERQAVLHDDPSAASAESLLEVDLQELDNAHLPLIGHKREKVMIDLSKSASEFRDSLLGVKASESRNVSILRPPLSPQEEKKLDHFQVTVKAVKRIELPELNDEFAQSIDPSLAGMANLRDAVRQSLQNDMDGLSYQRVSHLLVHQVVDNSRVDVPEGMLNDYLNRLVDDARKKVQDQAEPFDEALYRDRSRGRAAWNLKWFLIRKRIASQEGWAVTDEELEAEYQRLAAITKKSLTQIKATFADERRRDQLEDDLIERKVLQNLVQKAHLIDRTVSYEEFFAKEGAEHQH